MYRRLQSTHFIFMCIRNSVIVLMEIWKIFVYSTSCLFNDYDSNYFLMRALYVNDPSQVLFSINLTWNMRGYCRFVQLLTLIARF
jgi:hypothetical protein